MPDNPTLPKEMYWPCIECLGCGSHYPHCGKELYPTVFQMSKIWQLQEQAFAAGVARGKLLGLGWTETQMAEMVNDLTDSGREI